MHCMDIAFQFDNIERCEEMTGGGEDAYDLASKISSAWINFARNGNPNTPGLPTLASLHVCKRRTMILDIKCETRNHPDAELLKIVNTPKKQ